MRSVGNHQRVIDERVSHEYDSDQRRPQSGRAVAQPCGRRLTWPTAGRRGGPPWRRASVGPGPALQSPRAATSASPAVPARHQDHHRRRASSPPTSPASPPASSSARSAANAGANGNLVFSPASLTIALGMLRAGASGASASQIDHLLHTTSASELAQAMNALGQHLTGLAVPGANDQGNKGPVASRRPMHCCSGSRAVTSSRRSSACWPVASARRCSRSTTNTTPPALQTIDQWVSDHTNGQIPHLLTAGDLSMVTVLTLVNALYFKAPWFSAFAATSPDAPFRRLDGHTVETPTMTTFGSGVTHLRGAGWTAVRLPYAGRKLAMTVILPDNGQFGAVRSQLRTGHAPRPGAHRPLHHQPRRAVAPTLRHPHQRPTQPGAPGPRGDGAVRPGA